MTSATCDAAPYDLLGIGLGPFNLSLAALAEPVDGLRSLFLDARPRLSWHPGLLMEGTVLQVPFLADLVTMADPTSRWSFLNYLRAHGRLFSFFFAERFHIPRREYDHYLRWVAESLPSCRFGARVEALHWDEPAAAFVVEFVESGAVTRVLARNVVLGVGTEPVVPEPLAHLVGDEVFHAAWYVQRRAQLAGARDVTVVGSGQSGAEVFLDLLQAQAEGGWRLRWLARTPAFAPMEYSKLGLEHFTPDYISYFRALPEDVRGRLIPAQWQLYKGISEQTISDIYDLLYERSIGGVRPDAALMPGVAVTEARRTPDGYELTCRHVEQQSSFNVTTDRVVLATGYAARRPDFLDPLAALVDWDERGRYQVGGDYRVATDPRIAGGLYVQNAEMHTHGVGAPDLTLGAWRAATILNAVCGRDVQPLPATTAFTTFGVPPLFSRDHGVARSSPQPPAVENSSQPHDHGGVAERVRAG
jgi:lysine N6-hydroxylase